MIAFENVLYIVLGLLIANGNMILEFVRKVLTNLWKATKVFVILMFALDYCWCLATGGTGQSHRSMLGEFFLENINMKESFAGLLSALRCAAPR